MRTVIIVGIIGLIALGIICAIAFFKRKAPQMNLVLEDLEKVPPFQKK